MTRTLTASLTSEIATNSATFCHLYEFQFSGGTELFTDAAVNITWDQGASTTTKFVDTFTATNGVALDDHTADTPATEGWQASGGNLSDIQGNRAVNNWDGSAIVRAQTDGTVGVVFAGGDEVFADIYRPDTANDRKNGFIFLGDGSDDGLEVFLHSTDTTEAKISVNRRDTPGDNDQDDYTGPYTWTSGAAVRLGVTIVSGTSFAVWIEPAGGGTRTAIATWTTTDNYLDGSHNRVGKFHQTFGAPSNGVLGCDNLTVQTPGVGTTWTAIPISFEGVQETNDLGGSGVNITLDGVDTTSITHVLGENYIGRVAKIYLCHFDSDGTVTSDPLTIFSGYMNGTWTIKEKPQDTCTVSTRLVPFLSVLKQRRGIKASVHSHQAHYAGDTFFRHIVAIAQKQWHWGGRAGATTRRWAPVGPPHTPAGDDEDRRKVS